MAQMEDSINALLSNQRTVEQLMSLLGTSGNVRGVQSIAEQAVSGTPDLDAVLAAILANENLDPAIRELLGVLTGREGAQDETTALLVALRPFLGEAQQARLDQMLEALRLAYIAKLMARALGGGENCV